MIPYPSAFYIATTHPKRCKNIYYMTKLDVFVQRDATFTLSNTFRSTPAPLAHEIHFNDLVNIQMTPQKTGTWKE